MSKRDVLAERLRDVPRRIFAAAEVGEAVAFAADGGQALHLHSIIPDRGRAPACFVREVDRGGQIAHLFDRDRSRLVRTVRALGVRVVVVVEREGTARQHVDLCGGPLRKARALFREPA